MVCIETEAWLTYYGLAVESNHCDFDATSRQLFRLRNKAKYWREDMSRDVSETVASKWCFSTFSTKTAEQCIWDWRLLTESKPKEYTGTSCLSRKHFAPHLSPGFGFHIRESTLCPHKFFNVNKTKLACDVFPRYHLIINVLTLHFPKASYRI